jgi:hypothetical protein
MKSGRLEAFAGIAVAFIRPWLALLVYAGVAGAWIIPDRRIETALRPR